MPFKTVALSSTPKIQFKRFLSHKDVEILLNKDKIDLFLVCSGLTIFGQCFGDPYLPYLFPQTAPQTIGKKYISEHSSPFMGKKCRAPLHFHEIEFDACFFQ